MVVGIDIGGTNTDAAVVGEDIKTFKLPNTAGIEAVLDVLSSEVNLKNERVVVSTSLPLNAALSKFHEMPTLVLLIPGPGLDYRNTGVCLKGFVNHRGDVVEDIDPEEVRSALKPGYSNVAIAGKFSVRNPVLEERVREIVLEKFEDKNVCLSYHCLAINYPLRINTTIVNAKIKESVSELEKILGRYSEDFFFYKGDGGIIPIKIALQNPSLLYNSSPAAVAMGAIYLTGVRDAIVVDIGGTTTDFVVVRDGKPVIVENMSIAGMKTLIRCVDSFSIPFGGDSVVESFIKPERRGVSAAFGGENFTLTDSLNCCGCEIGDFSKSRELCRSKGIAEKAIQDYTAMVVNAISHEKKVDKVVVTGYLARYLAPYIEELCGKECIVPEHSEAVNAVGVAVSRISLTLYARFDTAKRRAVFNGVIEEYGDRDDDDYLIELAKERVIDMALSQGAMEEDVKDVKLVYFNSYNVIRGGVEKGRIADIVVQIEPGISSEFK